MSALCWFAISVALFNGCVVWFTWREGFDAGKARARHEGYGINSKTFPALLAKHLDLMDAEDESFVAYALGQAQKEHKREATP